jgi:hypothetical protein
MQQIGMHQSQNSEKKQVLCCSHNTFLVTKAIKFFCNLKHIRQLHNTKIKKFVLSSDFFL